MIETMLLHDVPVTFTKQLMSLTVPIRVQLIDVNIPTMKMFDFAIRGNGFPVRK